MSYDTKSSTVTEQTTSGPGCDSSPDDFIGDEIFDAVIEDIENMKIDNDPETADPTTEAYIEALKAVIRMRAIVNDCRPEGSISGLPLGRVVWGW